MSRFKEILEILESGPKTNQELLARLEKHKTSKATLNRDLAELLEQNIVEKIGKARATKYKLAKSYEVLKTIDVDKYFEGETKTRNAQKNFNFDILKLLNKISDELISQSEIKILDELNKKHQRKKETCSQGLLKKIHETICIDFAWRSSHIEGNTYTLFEAETLIKTGRTAGGKTRDEAEMLLNHKSAMDYIFENPKYYKSIDSKKILELHQILTKELKINTGIRKIIVTIGGTEYKPLDNEFQIKEALDEICKIINSTSYPITKAIVASALIAYLQAFEDGNKRTSRVLANAILLAHNYSPLSYANIDESEYKKAIVLFYEQNNLRYLKKLFLEQFEFAVDNYWR